MADAQHKDLAAGRWSSLTLAEQLGNVGSEVGRALSWQKKNNEQYREKALVRALELIDLTISDRRWIEQHRLKEILRTREILVDYFYGDNFYQTIPEQLEKYFYYFAFAARNKRP
ncbi:MAG: hypothetical protein AAB575_03270 [Patescibacteria group bacterium]